MTFKYNEDKTLEELKLYIEKTYDGHYSGGRNKTQSMDLIIDSGHGIGFTLGNVIKYAQRCTKKGKPSDWRADLMKVIHYAIIATYVLDLDNPPETVLGADNIFTDLNDNITNDVILNYTT